MRWNRLLSCYFFVALYGVSIPMDVQAGGAEFPAEGGHGMGRGGANMARSDDSWVLSRNPALLSDLWGSQISIGGNLAFSRPCFHPSGGYGWGEEEGDRVFLLGQDEEPIYIDAQSGSSGGALGSELDELTTDYYGEPFPEICAEWDSTFSPTIALTSRVDDKLGIGIALMPPEYAMLHQFGKPEGTVETRHGIRPNPVRYFSSLFSFTYFGLLTGVGYKVLPWLRIGAGIRWTMLMINTIYWDNDLDNRNPSADKRSDIFFQDLFIPGFIGSIHLVPIDNLDIAIGFKWEDRIKTQHAKMDVTQNVWGYGEPFSYSNSSSDEMVLSSTQPTVHHNIPLKVDSPPVTPPQLSFAIRYSDRYRPRPTNYPGYQNWHDRIQDSLSDEKWDIEFDAIYYFNSVKDQTTITIADDPTITQTNISTEGELAVQEVLAAQCDDGSRDVDCSGRVHSIDEYHGKDQLSLRLGGDYNLMPGVLALRAGVSWEDRGIDIQYAHPMYSYAFMRVGVHLGITWRIAERTDISFSYAHFFQETIELAINDTEGGGLPDSFREEDGQRLSNKEYRKKYHIIPEGDGVAKYAKFGDQYYHNAGSHWLNLDVIGGTLMQHF